MSALSNYHHAQSQLIAGARAKSRSIFEALNSRWTRLEDNDRAFTTFVLIMGMLPCLLMMVLIAR